MSWVKLNNQIETLKKNGCTKSLLPLSDIWKTKVSKGKVTADVIAPYLYWSDKLMNDVRSSKLNYSSMSVMRLNGDLKNVLYLKYFFTNHPICFPVFLYAFLPIGIILFLYMIIAYQGATKMELMLKSYVNGSLSPSDSPSGGRPHQGSSNADELEKLLKLKQQGVLNDAEFDREKKKILAA